MKDLLFKFSEDQDTDKRQALGVDNVPLNESGLRDLLVSFIIIQFLCPFTIYGQTGVQIPSCITHLKAVLPGIINDFLG